MEAEGTHLDRELPSRPNNLEQVKIGSQRRYGMWWFLASLAVLFAATIVGYLAIRIGKSDWALEELPPLPWTLWISIVVLLKINRDMARVFRLTRLILKHHALP